MRVVLVRGLQEIRLEVMERRGAWPRLARRLERFWRDDRVRSFVNKYEYVVLSGDGAEGFRHGVCQGRIDDAAVLARAERVLRRDFEIFGSPVPRDGPQPWNRDWRYDREWPNADFRTYSHHEARDEPYDVKFPWELSRLGFLLPLLQGYVVRDAHEWARAADEILSDWCLRNPLARSVNWAPMEASVRALNLLMALELTLQTSRDFGLVAKLCRMLCEHGEFIARTVEDADVRGNHYAANIVALLLLGLTLKRHYPPAAHWLRYAIAQMDREVQRQFFADGINFEKSTAYHRLVTELFLLAARALRRFSLPISAASHSRLHAACRFVACCLRPDGRLPIIGDTDDAQLFGFDPAPARDPSALLALAAIEFEDDELAAAAGRLALTVPWLGGRSAVAVWSCPAASSLQQGDYFPIGGVAVARSGGSYLLVDVGEVGLEGRGGHGHNDLLSFELCLGGRPIVIDPGCSTYTGDAELRTWFRSTAGHNGLTVDGEEIAPLLGPFRIADDARPTDVQVTSHGAHWTIRAGHTGYLRRPVPAHHRRQYDFDAMRGALDVTDEVDAVGSHVAVRSLHFPPDASIELSKRGAAVETFGQRCHIAWDDRTQATVEYGWISYGYGHLANAPVLVLSTEFAGEATLQLQFSAEGNAP